VYTEVVSSYNETQEEKQPQIKVNIFYGFREMCSDCLSLFLIEIIYKLKEDFIPYLLYGNLRGLSIFCGRIIPF